MKKDKKTNIMAASFMLFFLLLFLVVSGRFIYIQVTGKSNDVALNEYADSKRETSITLNAERGQIYDQEGMSLAYNRPTYRVYAVLDESYSQNQPEDKHVSDVDETSKKLADFLEMDQEEIKEKLEDGEKDDRFQVEFGSKGKNLSQKTMEKIRDEDIPGIYFSEDAIRYYPNGTFASHIIGFARPDEDGKNIVGEAGMEQEKNDLLTGEDGYIRYNRDKYNEKLLNTKEETKEEKDGKDIHLTLNQKIQTLLEDVVSQVDAEYNPKRITAVMMDPQTGEIIALTNRPSYNPNKPEDVENWYNDVISTPVEPGSTMKVFTWASAIEEGVYDGDDTFKSGSYSINDKVAKINDHNNGEGWGEISYDEGFRRSSNVAASKLVWEKIKPDKYLDYLEKFQLDEETDIDLPSEEPGKITYDYPSDKLRTAFGQSTTLTPIQELKGATAFVNGGELLKPYVIDKIVDANTNETEVDNKREVAGEAISEDTADQMMELMEDVVEGDNGTGNKFQLDDYSMVGKTGTSQIPNDEDSGYMTGKENHRFSFLSIAPKDDPKLMMHVSVTQPELDDDESGSDPVSFIVKNVMENGLHYLNIEPDQEEDEEEDKKETVQLPEVEGEATKKVEKELKEKDVKVTVVGDGEKITDSNMEEGTELLDGQRVILLTDKPKMPKIKGWSQRDIVFLSEALGLELDMEGSGYAVKQSIKADKKIKEGQKLEVKLKHSEEKKE
ncbi:MAG TPA: penicillin-binding transpeptidase domain-containing protein [Pseudogracilibacillus sp.]|nr:penicillin-binding transpeptidase domain-containing protein [Pseudogracilibacillus sp.]